jgi:hypothetical protein
MSNDAYEQGDWEGGHCRVDELAPDELQCLLDAEGQVYSDGSPGSGCWEDYSASEGSDEF